MDQDERGVLRRAVERSRRAPSEHNSQPWRWVLGPDRLRLFVADDRRLPVTDPEGHGTLVGCGCALHHLRIALAVAGRRAEVAHLPGGVDALAVVRALAPARADDADRRQAGAIETRRCDRRRFSDREVGTEEIEGLIDASRRWGGTLDLVVGRTRQQPGTRATARQRAPPPARRGPRRPPARRRRTRPGDPAPTARRGAGGALTGPTASRGRAPGLARAVRAPW